MILGVKAAPGDADRMAALEHARFLETVLTGEDLAKRFSATVAAYRDHEVRVVHAPFRVPGGRELDVADPDPCHREKSRMLWRLSLRLARQLDARFVVLHPGGIVTPQQASGAEKGALRASALDRTQEALAGLADEGGADLVLVENMPAHYHRASGVTDATLTGSGVIDLLAWRDHVAGMCLDTSHAVLTPGGTKTLEVFLRRGSHMIRHLHLSDARPPHGEGLALGTGVIDWDRFRTLLEGLDAAVGAVPEVQGGHNDNGRGFQEALRFARDRLLG